MVSDSGYNRHNRGEFDPLSGAEMTKCCWACLLILALPGLAGCVASPDYQRVGGGIKLALPDFIPISLGLEASLETGTEAGVRAARSDDAVGGVHRRFLQTGRL